jgi:hypothetical protein
MNVVSLARHTWIGAALFALDRVRPHAFYTREYAAAVTLCGISHLVTDQQFLVIAQDIEFIKAASDAVRDTKFSFSIPLGFVEMLYGDVTVHTYLAGIKYLLQPLPFPSMAGKAFMMAAIERIPTFWQQIPEAEGELRPRLPPVSETRLECVWFVTFHDRGEVYSQLAGRRFAPTAIFPHVLELFGVSAAQYSKHFYAVIRLR